MSLRWLLGFIAELYQHLPDDLNCEVKAETERLIIHTFESEIDEMFSFVGNKANKQWIWIAMDTKSRQIVAFHVGDRSGQSLKPCSSQYPSATRSMPRSIPMAGVLATRNYPLFQNALFQTSFQDSNGISKMSTTRSEMPYSKAHTH